MISTSSERISEPSGARAVDRMKALDLSVYLVTDRAQIARAGHTIASLVAQAAAGGVTTIQVREKTASARDFLDTVLAIADILPEHASLIVNDRIDVFLAARSAGRRVAGVHVGQSDLPATVVRELIGPQAVLGLSASTPAEISALTGVDYVGIGALHATQTKSDAPPSLGIDAFRGLVAFSPVPAVAIGGVTVADMADLRRAGAAGGAIVSAICLASDPRSAAAELRSAWNSAV